MPCQDVGPSVGDSLLERIDTLSRMLCDTIRRAKQAGLVVSSEALHWFKIHDEEERRLAAKEAGEAELIWSSRQKPCIGSRFMMKKNAAWQRKKREKPN